LWLLRLALLPSLLWLLLMVMMMVVVMVVPVLVVAVGRFARLLRRSLSSPSSSS
jgi:hypothetical protein